MRGKTAFVFFDRNFFTSSARIYRHGMRMEQIVCLITNNWVRSTLSRSAHRRFGAEKGEASKNNTLIKDRIAQTITVVLAGIFFLFSKANTAYIPRVD